MNKILFIDTLTTGPFPSKCGIYAIGGSVCEDTQTETRELKRFEFRMRPFEDARIIDKSLWLGGMTRSQLIYFKKEAEVLEDFVKMLSDVVKVSDPADKIFLCGFNTSAFDMPFLKEWFDRNENRNFRNVFHMQSIDLLSVSAYALMEERTAMKEFNLDSVARKLGILTKVQERYSCLDNVAACIGIYRKLKERLGMGEWGSFTESGELIVNY